MFVQNNFIQNNYMSVTQEQAENALKFAPDGAWLLRECRYQDCTKISFRHHNGAIDHALLQKAGDVWYKMDEKTNSRCSEAVAFEKLLADLGINPNLQLISRPVTLPEKSDSTLEAEFNRLPQNMDDFKTCTYALEHRQGNRFLNILPFNHNAFKGKGYYYNASRLFEGRAIACQGPEEKHRNDFWKMAWQSNTSSIVMLTKTQECCRYWPEAGKKEAYGAITVEGLEEKIEGNLITRTCKVQNLAEKDREEYRDRTITLVQFTGWPDHGAAKPKEMARIIQKVAGTYSKESPVMVHCRAGVGRTGTLLAALFAYQQICEDPSKAQDPDLFSSVATEIRNERIGAIQSPDQYKCGYQTLEELVKVKFNANL